MEEEQVSYEVLQDLLRTERRGNKLTPLPPRFWSEVRSFLTGITERFRTEQAKDPWSRRVMVLSDEVKNARQAARSLWALRERKLAMLALAHTHDRQRPAGITPDEAELYARLLEVLDAARESVLEEAGRPDTVPARPAAAAPAPDAVKTTGSGAAAQAPPSTPARPSGSGPAAAPAAVPPDPPQTPADSGAVPEGDAAGAPQGPGPDKQPPRVPADVGGDGATVAIRALGDIPPFVGPDMQTYVLKEGDVATVPEPIARLLERRKKAAVVNDK